MENVTDFMIQELSAFSPKRVAQGTFQMPVSVERISEDSAFRQAILYVGFQSEIQQRISRIHKTILYLIEDMGEFSAPLNQDNEIVIFPREVDVFRLVEECRNILRRRVLFDCKSRILLECVNQTEDLDEIISIIAEQLQNPVIVLDISYKVLGYSKNYEVEDYQWQQNINRGYCSYEYIGAFNRIEGVSSAPDTNEPFIIDCFTSHLRRYISKIYLGERQLGYLIAIESVTPFSQIDPNFFKLISSSLARIIHIRNQLNQNVNNRMYDSIFIDCIEGNFKSRSAFLERIALTGIKTDSFYQLLSIDISSYNNFDPGHEHLRSLINRLFYRCIVICYNNNVVVLVDIQAEKDHVINVLKSEKTTFKQYKVRVGISDVFSDLFQIRPQYQNAVSALMIANAVAPNECFAIYDDYKLYNLIYAVGNENDLRAYVHSTVKNILDYDEMHGTEYYETMYSYLKNARRLDDTARNLFIHKNTVSYRINKMREIFNVDFDDANMAFNLHFSCKVVEILNRYLLTK